ncbi:GIY-YIG nuclease family protein [bacterium]|nr:GIY-YIG nuclease family protein [bacterium]
MEIRLKGYFYTYLIQSKKNGQWYIGSTVDLRKRSPR